MPLHPFIQRAVRRAYQLGHGDLPYKDIDQIRAYYKYPLPAMEGAHFEDIEVKKGVICRIHRPSNATAKLPLVAYLRASAYILGSIDNANLFCQQLANYLGCAVVAIEPRISPEYKFPQPLEDCIACVDYLYQHHHRLGLNIKKAAIWGDSSGGNIASALCHYYQQQQQIFTHQVLIYPMLDYYHRDYQSKQLYGAGYLMDTLLCDRFISHYVCTERDYENPFVSPLLATSFSNLPTTLVIAAQYDPMRDEAWAYVDCLKASGVNTVSLTIPGMTHGFLYYARKLPEARFTLETAAHFLKEGFI